MRLTPILLITLCWSAADAGQVTVAAASNFRTTLDAIAEAFAEESGHTVRISSGSTGKLYAQIVNGAPFDVFLAADVRRPALLEASGLGVSRITYANGSLVLWSRDPLLAGTDCRESLKDLGSGYLAIANPDIAPYGAAAVEFLKNSGLWASVEANLVFGENISQTLQFVTSGNARLGLIAHSQVLDDRLPDASCEWPVPKETHGPIEQQAVLLRAAEGNPAAAAFMRFLEEPAAQAIITAHGYTVPQ